MRDKNLVVNNIWKLIPVDLGEELVIYNPIDKNLAICNHTMFDVINHLRKNPFLLSKLDINIIDQITELIDSNTPYFEWIEAQKRNELGGKLQLRSLIIIPTYDCNLRCLYCYSNAGERKNYITWSLVQCGIDFFLRNLKKGEKPILLFHGGGEPTLGFEIIKKSVEYLQVCGIRNKIQVGLVTNGIMSVNKIDWVVENIDKIEISLDGPPEIHNKMRIDKYNRGSYNRVARTIRRILKQRKNISIRATITEYSLNSLKEIIDMCKEFGIRQVNISPVEVTGRCVFNNIKGVDPKEYVEKLKEALDYAENKKIFVGLSVMKLNQIRVTACDASGKVMFLTPDGLVTSCLEALNDGTKNSDVFIYGVFDETKKIFLFDNEKLNYLRSRTVDRISICQDCVAKWHCAGGCHMLAIRHNNDMFKPDTNSCHIIIETIKYYLKRLLRNRKLERNKVIKP